jgi:hypothetical protein
MYSRLSVRVLVLDSPHSFLFLFHHFFTLPFHLHLHCPLSLFSLNSPTLFLISLPLYLPLFLPPSTSSLALFSSFPFPPNLILPSPSHSLPLLSLPSPSPFLPVFAICSPSPSLVSSCRPFSSPYNSPLNSFLRSGKPHVCPRQICFDSGRFLSTGIALIVI